MSVKPLLLLSILTLAASTRAAPLPLHADPLETAVVLTAEAGQVLRLPAPRALPPVSIRQQTYPFDGMPISYRILEAGPFRLRLPWEIFSAWSIQHTAGTGDIHGSAPGLPAVTLRVALLPGGGPLGGLGAATWNAYLAGLAAQAPQARSILLASDDSDANPQMLRLLGGRTRLALIESAGARGEALRSLHAAMALPEGTALFVLTGPAGDVERVQGLFSGFLTAVDAVP
ncbi:MAG: hypothetical protein ABII82_04210 [Verrucomicrobiota bacterium]